MATNTSIEWTDSTWNPIIGCSRVSEGCRHCYAEGIAARFVNTSGPYSGLTRIVNGHPQWTGKISETKQLLDPLRWRKPRRIFVNSMSDLFHENVTDEMRDRIFAVMALCPQHTFQVLTKRPERMQKYLTGAPWGQIEVAAQEISERYCELIDVDSVPLPNVWLGVSVENQPTADERIPLLLQTPAAKRFISAEPLLGPVMLPRKVFLPRLIHGDFPIGHNLSVKGERVALFNPHGALAVRAQGGQMLGIKPGEFEDCGVGIDWVIVGGESGPGARPMHPDWARSLRDQCQAAGVPFFFKQWGEWLPSMQDGTPGYNQEINCSDRPVRVGKKAAGALLDGCEWREFPKGDE